MVRTRAASLLCLAAVLALAACGPPQQADVGSPERLRNLARPDLAPTATFDAALAAAEPDADRLDRDADALATRAEALSTALVILEPARGVAIVEGLPGCETRIENQAGEVFESTGWRAATRFEELKPERR